MAARNSPGLGLLAAGNSQGLLEAGFSLSHIRSGLAQQQFALEPIRFDEPVPLVACFHRQQGLGQQAPPLPRRARHTRV